MVHRHRNWQRISAAALLCYRWDGRRAGLYVHLRPGSHNEESLIAVLKDLRSHFRGHKVHLIWDGLTSHRSSLMRERLEHQRNWLTVERLPGYTPDLNPAEGLWADLKGTELANRCDLEIVDTVAAADDGINRVRSTNSSYSASSVRRVFLFSRIVTELCEALWRSGHRRATPDRARGQIVSTTPRDRYGINVGRHKMVLDRFTALAI